MPGINQQVSPKGPAISRAVPALQQIEQNSALAPAIGGAFGVPFRKFGQTDSPSTLYNPNRMRAIMTGAQTISATLSGTPNWQIIQFNSVSGTGLYDLMNAFNTTTFQWKAPVSGYYRIQARISGLRVTTNAPSLTFVLSIFVNGAEPTNPSRGQSQAYVLQATSGTGIVTSYLGPLSAVHGDGLIFNQGDLVDVRAANYASSDAITTDTSVNYFAIALDASL